MDNMVQNFGKQAIELNDKLNTKNQCETEIKLLKIYLARIHNRLPNLENEENKNKEKIQKLIQCISDSEIIISKILEKNPNVMDNYRVLTNSPENINKLRVQKEELLKKATDAGINAKIFIPDYRNIDKIFETEVLDERQSLLCTIPFHEISFIKYNLIVVKNSLSLTEKVLEEETIYLEIHKKDKKLNYILLETTNSNPQIISGTIIGKNGLYIPRNRQELNKLLKDANFKQKLLKILTERNHIVWQEEIINSKYDIYNGYWLSKLVSIKSFKNCSNNDYSFKKNIEIFNKLRSPFIVQLYGICVQKHLILEYMPNELNKILINNITLLQKKQLAIGIANCLSYLHARNLIHTRLQPEAIFLSADNNVKLDCFEQVKKYNNAVECLEQNLTTNNKLWLPVESQTKGIITPSTNIYSYGMILRYIFSGKHPSIKTNREVNVSENIIPKEINTIIDNCRNTFPKKRPNMIKVLETLKNYEPPKPAALTSYEILKRGKNFEKDFNYNKAANDYIHAMAKGNKNACTRLGILIWNKGQHLLKNEIENKKLAYNLLEIGHKHGDPLAMLNLANLHKDGYNKIIPKNSMKSSSLLQKAEASGSLLAMKKIDQ